MGSHDVATRGNREAGISGTCSVHSRCKLELPRVSGKVPGSVCSLESLLKCRISMSHQWWCGRRVS